MWKISKAFVRRRRLDQKHLFALRSAVVATETGSGVWWLVRQQQSSDDDDAATNSTQSEFAPTTFQSNILRQHANLPSWLVPPTAAQCEPLGLRVTRLRRHQTIQKLEKTAEKDTINSRYKVDWKHPLGEGTFGKVFQGVDRRTKEKVAVKKISKAFTDNEAFTREMDALLHLRQYNGHPNICGLRENFDEDNFYYLVLDLVTGGEMFDALCANGAYSELDAARLVREVANALHFMHGIGIVHGACVRAFQ